MLSTHISNIRENVLRNIGFSQVVENMQPKTINGNDVKTYLVEAVNAGKFCTVSAILNGLNVINGGSQFDNALMHASENITEQLNEHSFNAKLVHVAECIDSSKHNEFAKAALTKLDALAQMSVNEALESIRSGYLTQFVATYPQVKLLIDESAIKTSATNESTADYAVKSPFTITSNKGTFVKIHNKIYGFNNTNVVETSAPSEQFNYLTSVLNEVNYDDLDKSFTFEHQAIGTVKATSHSIELNESAYSINNFSKQAKRMLESKYYNNPRLESLSKQLIDGCVMLAEHLNDVTKVDNVIVVDKVATNETFAMFKLPSATYVATVKSVRYPQVLEAFENPNDAITFLKKRSGYDATEFLAEILATFNEHSKEQSAFISEQLDIVNAIQSKVQEIENMLVEAKTSGNIEQTKELQHILEDANALLIEQKSILAEASK